MPGQMRWNHTVASESLQRGSWRRLGIGFVTAVTLSTGVPSVPAFGQDSAPKGIEIYGGARRLNSPAPMVPQPSQKTANSPATVEQPPRPPLPGSLRNQIADLEQQSTDAFQRGLLPLADYLEHLRLVHSVEQRFASERGDKRGVAAAAQRHVSRLQQATGLLEAFRQPASAGWVADTLLAQAVTAEAEAEMAALRGNRQEAELAEQKFQQFSLQHLQALEFDERELGLGSLPTTAAAVAMVETADPSASTADATAAVRNYVLLTTERWNAGSDSGIGRSDEVLKAEASAAADRGKWALVSKDMPQFAADVTQAEEAAQSLFNQRLEFYKTGTASLADLTNSLMLRNRVHQLASSADGVYTEQMDRRWERDLHQLVDLSNSVEDRRGRNAADVGFVQILNVLDANDRSAGK